MKQYWYVICLLTNDCYGDFIEGSADSDGSCPVCVDFSVAVRFEDTDQAHDFAHNACQLSDGEYAIHGYFF